jgi:pre-mRNA-splicing factor ISY1
LHGRAKELPGVKELFQSKKKEEKEESIALSFHKKYESRIGILWRP